MNILGFWVTTRQSKLFNRDEERIPCGFWQYLVYAVVTGVIYGTKTLLSPDPLTSCTRTSQTNVPKHMKLLILGCHPWPNPYFLDLPPWSQSGDPGMEICTKSHTDITGRQKWKGESNQFWCVLSNFIPMGRSLVSQNTSPFHVWGLCANRSRILHCWCNSR